MKTIKDELCSIELSKKLKEIGYPQDGQWFWIDDGDGETFDIVPRENLPYCNEGNIIYLSPTVAELGDKIPPLYLNRIVKSRFGYWSSVERTLDIGKHKKEADARASMFILYTKIEKEGEKQVKTRELARCKRKDVYGEKGGLI